MFIYLSFILQSNYRRTYKNLAFGITEKCKLFYLLLDFIVTQELKKENLGKCFIISLCIE